MSVSVHVENRGELVGIGSLCPTCGSQDRTQVIRPTSFPEEPIFQPNFSISGCRFSSLGETITKKDYSLKVSVYLHTLVETTFSELGVILLFISLKLKSGRMGSEVALS